VRAPQAIVPALVIVAAAAGVGGARLFAAPSVVRDFAPAGGGASRAVTFVVDGVRCVDTAERAAQQLVDAPGVIRFTAWASRARVEVVYDPAATDAQAIRDAIEGPVHDETSGEYLFGIYTVREVDGVKVAESSR